MNILAEVPLNTWILAGVAIMNAFTLYYTRRTEKNTNSISERNEAIAKTLGIHEGREEMRVEAKADAKAAEPAHVIVVPDAPIPVINVTKPGE